MLGSLKQLEVSPPPGWHVFGTHLDVDTELDFYGEEFTEDGMPLWERPKDDNRLEYGHKPYGDFGPTYLLESENEAKRAESSVFVRHAASRWRLVQFLETPQKKEA